MSCKNKKTILLVEDEPLIAAVQKKILEKYGYNIILADTGDNALKVFRENNDTDLILMDIDLGKGIDGPETALRILKEREIPIIFLSSHTEPEIVEKTEKITSYGYVVKNSGITVLDASIKMGFKLFEANKQIAESEVKQKAMISNISDVIGIIGIDGIMKYKSPNVKKWFGWRPEDLVGTDGWLTVHPDDLERVKKEFYSILEKDNSSKTVEYRYKCKNGSYKTIELTAINLINDPIINGVLLNYHDITDRKMLEAALEKRMIALTSPLHQMDGVKFEDLFEPAVIQRIQDEFSTAAGVSSIITLPDGTPITSPSNFTDLCNNIIRKNEKGCSNCFISDAVIGRYHAEGPVVQPCLSGGLWDAGASIVVGDRHVANWLVGQVRDETQSEEKMREYAREIGVDEAEAIEAFRKVPAMSLSRFKEIARALFTLANQLSTAAYQNVQQARFITERRKIEEKLKQQMEAIEASMDGIAILDSNEIYVYVNEAHARIYNYDTSEELLGKSWRILYKDDELARFDNSIMPVLKMNGRWQGESIGMKKDGSTFHQEVSLTALENGDLICVVRDISGRIQAENKIKNLLVEKELLLKEVHHRIRNNMNAIHCLLTLQAETLEDISAITALEDASSRVQSMMVLYDKLYKSSGFTEVSIPDYLSTLVDEIIENFPNSGSVKIVKKIDDFVLDVKRLQPLGIIINEVLTNIMKYAFAGRVDGIISINAVLAGNMVSVVIEDNGVGMPDSIDFENSKGFGMQLVNMLSEQIGGSIKIERGEGTRFVLEFKV